MRCAGHPVSAGTIAAVLTETAGRITPALAEIRRLLAAASIAHFDETGTCVAAKAGLVPFGVHRHAHAVHRACQARQAAMDAAGVLPAFGGVAVHDGPGPTGAMALTISCAAPTSSASSKRRGEQGEDWAEHLAETLRCAKRWTDDARAEGAHALPAEQLAAVRARYAGHVQQGLAAHPPPPLGRKKKRPKVAALADRLDRCRDDVLRFATDLSVPFDNNLAERDIRMVKLQLKVSGCWRLSRVPKPSRPCAAISPPPANKARTSWPYSAPPSPANPGSPPSHTQPGPTSRLTGQLERRDEPAWRRR